MGVDICGSNPTSEAGAYFGLNWWYWIPIVEYIGLIAPDIAVHCEHWGTNDGDGLDSELSEDLSRRIMDAIASGHAGQWRNAYQDFLDSLPNEKCDICAGTGKRKPGPNTGAGNEPCGACDSTGEVRPFDCRFPFDIQVLAKFATFLAACGGFRIW